MLNSTSMREGERGRERERLIEKVRERERERGELKRGMDQQVRMEKKNKTLGTERCKSIDSLYINKIEFKNYI